MRIKHVITLEGEADPSVLEDYLYSDLEDSVSSLNDAGLAKLQLTIKRDNKK